MLEKVLLPSISSIEKMCKIYMNKKYDLQVIKVWNERQLSCSLCAVHNLKFSMTLQRFMPTFNIIYYS